MNSTSYIAGCDLHKDSVYLSLMDNQGYIQEQGRYSVWDNQLVDKLVYYQEKAPVTVVVEATYGWYGFAKAIEDKQIDLVLAHAQHVNRVAGAKKTDKGDAKILANLYRTNMLQTAYLPTPEIRQLKETLRFRSLLVGKRSDLTRRLLDVAQKQHLQFPYSDTCTKQAIKWWLTQAWDPTYAQEVTSILSVLQTLNQQIETVNQKVASESETRDEVKLLKSIPGLGKILALTLWVEIGDVTRFKDDRALSSYAGVVPSIHASANTTIMGKTGNRGNGYIRWALAEAVPHLVRADEGIKTYYESLKARKGSNKAKVAVMNKLLRICYGILKHHHQYQFLNQINSTTSNLSPSSSKAN